MDQRQLQIVLKLQDQASQELKKLSTNLNQIDKGSAKTSDSMRELESMSKQVAMALGVAVTVMLGWGVKVAAQLETAQVGLETLLGSASEAASTVERLKKEAARTPFELPGLTQATQLLTSVTKDGNKSIDILLDVGEALAAMGKGQAELDRIIVNLQQIAATGRAMTIDIKQFAFAGIPIYEMLSDATGKYGEDLQDLISTGGVTFDLLVEMFDKANDEGGKFFNAFKNQAGTFNQAASNMKDSFGIFMSDVVKNTGLFNLLKKSMVGVSESLGGKDSVAVTVMGVVGVFGLLAARLGVMVIIGPKITAIFTAMKIAIASTGGVLTIFAATMAILASIISKKLNEPIKEMTAFMEENGDKVSRLTDKYRELKKPLEADEEQIKAFAEAVRLASKDVEKAQESLNELIESHSKSVRDIKQNEADAIIDQEKKIGEMQKEIADLKLQLNQETSRDSKRKKQEEIADLELQLEKEKQALGNYSEVAKGLDSEIKEARRFGNLTAFEQKMETLAQEEVAENEQFDKRMTRLKEELKETQIVLAEKIKAQKEYYDDLAEREKQRQIDFKNVKDDLILQIALQNALNRLSANKKGDRDKDYIEEVKMTISRFNKMMADNDNALPEDNPFDIVDGAIVPRRAKGGPVSGNTPYIVGEQGPELFMPNTGGSIIPNGDMSGVKVSVVVNGDVSGQDLIEKVTNAIALNIKRRVRI